jgi:hypothetical protein
MRRPLITLSACHQIYQEAEELKAFADQCRAGFLSEDNAMALYDALLQIQGGDEIQLVEVRVGIFNSILSCPTI